MASGDLVTMETLGSKPLGSSVPIVKTEWCHIHSEALATVYNGLYNGLNTYFYKYLKGKIG